MIKEILNYVKFSSGFEILGTDKMDMSIRLFVPISTQAEKIESDKLINKLTNILSGFTISEGKGVYKMKSNNTIIEEKSLVIDISINDNATIKKVINEFKEYGLLAKEESLMFILNGISYFSNPKDLKVI